MFALWPRLEALQEIVDSVRPSLSSPLDTNQFIVTTYARLHSPILRNLLIAPAETQQTWRPCR